MTKDFLWGVATSGYQCEGGYNGAGQPQNNWSDLETNGDVMATGLASDFWHRYEEDFALGQGMGLNAFRLSIEWARVQPSTSTKHSAPPPFDLLALDAYADRIAACRRHGMEPVVTLHHFTQPAWVGTDAWLDDATPGLFEKFVTATVTHVNRRLVNHHSQQPIHWYVTINEPNMLVLNTYFNRHFPHKSRGGMRNIIVAYSRILAAHVRAYNAIHDLYESENWPTPKVTMNTFCSDVYWSEKMLLDLLCLREHHVQEGQLQAYLRDRSNHLHHAILEAKLPFKTDLFFWIGRLFHGVINVLAPRYAFADAFRYYLDTLAQSKRDCVLDYLGLDYYDAFTAHLFRYPSFADLEFKSKSLRGHLMNGLSSKWWDWRALPEGMHFFCKYYAREYNRSILIAENGMALRQKFDNSVAQPRSDRLTRSEFLTAHVGQVRRLVEEGVPILGYLHWSLTDNYEWGSYTPRFGLITIDYAKDAKRVLTDQLGDTPSQTYARLIAEARAAC